jgi:hypothetical protein
MLQTNPVTTSAAYAMFAACGLGIGFLVRFLIALGGAGERSKATSLLRLRNTQPTAVTVHRVVGDRWFPVNAATPISMGVLRITTALSSSPILENKPVGAERADIVYSARVHDADWAPQRLIARSQVRSQARV